MTRKEQIRRTLEKQPDDVSFDRMIYLLTVMRDIEIGLEEQARGEGTDHDELFDRLLSKYAKSKGDMGAARGKATGSPRTSHRAKRSENRGKVRATIAKEDRKT